MFTHQARRLDIKSTPWPNPMVGIQRNPMVPLVHNKSTTWSPMRAWDAHTYVFTHIKLVGLTSSPLRSLTHVPCRLLMVGVHRAPMSRCHDSSRVSAMPTSRAYDTRYAIHLNMLTHDSHGLHAVIINMDLRVHGHVLYKRRHACSTTTNGCLG